MLALDMITVICFDGRPIDEAAQKRYNLIFSYMQNHFRFHKIKFFNPSGYKHLGIDSIRIEQCGIGSYNEWFLKKIKDEFSTSHALVIQDDGFPLNPDKWQNEFLDYDYIGAPWPLYIGWPKEGFQVGNGGFSLRSNRLCKEIARHPSSSANEDAYISTDLRPKIESRGFKWPSVDLARKFSLEIQFEGSDNLDTPFGFHGKRWMDEALERIK